MEEAMLDMSEFTHNHHPSGVKMLAKYIRGAISVLILLALTGCVAGPAIATTIPDLATPTTRAVAGC